MGPAGSGKTTVGRLVSAELCVPFADGDDFHSPSAIEKMRSGTPLDDADRAPWLARLARLVEESGESGLVLACSALRARYRVLLTDATNGDPSARLFVAYLSVPKHELARRLALRAGHFAGPSLVDSQLAALEPPDDDSTFDGMLAPEVLAERIAARVRAG